MGGRERKKRDDGGENPEFYSRDGDDNEDEKLG